jgi:vanillate O-demethylase monooxygenase subunit
VTEAADYRQGFVRSHWYAAAWRSEIGSAPFPRTVLGERIVLFAAAGGTIAALQDRCPHRLAPLSMGECVDGGLRCGYHGLLFSASGQCVSVPGQARIPPGATVKSFPVRERYGLVWVWMADMPPDDRRLPVIEKFGQPGWALLGDGYQYHAANYRIEIENLMDPAHTTFLHKLTIGNAAAKDVPVSVERTDRSITAFRWLEKTPPSPFDRQSHDFGDVLIDRLQSFSFELPCTSIVEVCSMPAGLERNEANKNRGLRTFSYKFLTPEDERHTHFFWLHLRNFRLDDPVYEQQLCAGLEQTYVEDNAVASAIQLEQVRTGRRQYIALEIDRAPLMALRLIDRMIAEENSASAVHPNA